MSHLSVWRKKPRCELISILDGGFAILTLVLYTCNFILEERKSLELLRGLVDIEQHWDGYVLVWVTIYLFNIVQFLIAFLLFKSLHPAYPDGLTVQYKAQRWLRFSSLIFMLLLLKFVLFMIYFVKEGKVDAITLLVCLLDIIFRMVTVYMVKRFVDDLKLQFPVPPPTNLVLNLFKRRGPTTTTSGNSAA